jgi:hypothetical protein
MSVSRSLTAHCNKEHNEQRTDWKCQIFRPLFLPVCLPINGGSRVSASGSLRSLLSSRCMLVLLFSPLSRIAFYVSLYLKVTYLYEYVHIL